MERARCTRDDPYTPGRDKPKLKRWVHEDAHQVPGTQEDGWPGGDTVEYHCPNCGLTWRAELPQ